MREAVVNCKFIVAVTQRTSWTIVVSTGHDFRKKLETTFHV